ncbi:hypothetical protein EMPS_09135 [Entomortierella parvispora]|uniref:MPN domain-containing protein n=1 Tax=Entomortierella parvispora TaxID=205924 RepID=A0A9P3HHL4_9FUNG|nr:hypothetical protein EMPS_09135 [Entomortierella parvispora]
MPPKKASSDGSKSSKKLKSDNDGSDAMTGRAMTKEEEEALSSAAIAQLLAQEGGDDQNGYYAEYNNNANYDHLGGDYSDDDDDYRYDYNYKPKSRSRRAAPQARKRAKKAPAPVKAAPAKVEKKASAPESKAAPASDSQEPSQETEKTGKTTIDAAATTAETVSVKTDSSSPVSKASSSTAAPAPAPAPAAPKVKVVKEAPQGLNTGVYSDVEERAFVKALELYGRNWRSVEEHVATRDANSIRSHAQKHFIKLFRDNIPLPAKVLESGPGYTLSGNDLDPYSSAARPYLAQRLAEDPSSLPIQGGTVFTPTSGALAKAEKAQMKERKANEDAAKASMKEAVNDMKDLKIKRAVREPREPREPARQRVRADSPPEPTYTGRTDYSKARLRSARDHSSISFRQMASDLDPLTMVKCEPFCGQPNSGVAGCQPFGIKVQSNVLLGMDFHAHLMTAEIIGFLAGDWNPETRMIHIKAIFPCRSLPTGQNHINVEMDPTSEFEVRQEIEKRNMRIVGWYHSHPTFTPDPSLVDIENQTSYQSLFKDESLNEEPFVGAIVGPYDERLPGMSSVINWFYISQSPQERGHPKRLLYDLIEDTELPLEESTLWTKLFDEYRNSPERANFNEQWRQEETETRLQKMLVSLGRRMPWLRNNLLKNKDAADTTTDAVTTEVEMETATSETMDISETATETPAISEDVSVESVEVTAALDDGEQQTMPMEGVEPATTEPSTEQEGDSKEGEGPGAEEQQKQQPLGESMSRSPSRESITSSGSGRLYPGLAGLLNDPFLIQVEQELSSWEAVVG